VPDRTISREVPWTEDSSVYSIIYQWMVLVPFCLLLSSAPLSRNRDFEITYLAFFLLPLSGHV
jgi:hypothetical protein